AAKEAHVLSENDLQDVRDTIETYQQQTASDEKEKNMKWQTWKQKRRKTADYTLIGGVALAFISSIMLWFFNMKGIVIVPVIVFLAGVGIRSGLKRSIRSMENVFHPGSNQMSRVITESVYNEAKQQMANHERNMAELTT